MLDLKVAIRRLEVAAKVPRLVAEANDEIERTRQAIEAHGNSEERALYEQLKSEIQAALSGDADLLEKKVNRLFQLRLRVIARTPDYWLGFRDYLRERQADMTDKAQAQMWFVHAERAISAGDLEGLKSSCKQLQGLLPITDQRRGYGGTTVKAHGGR